MAKRKQTIIWRSSVATVLAGAIALSLYDLKAEQNQTVNTQAMLDVSVSIKTVSHVTVDRFGDSIWSFGSGSGFVVNNAECEVWTNHHVIEKAAFIEVYPRGWTATHGIPAKVISATPRADIALLKMESCDNIPAAKLGNSTDLTPGEETYAVGNPLGSNPDSISRGIISHTKRFVTTTIPYLQTDAAINPGNSGGALFNRKGEVIGINTAIAASRSRSNIGIGYALPINIAKYEAQTLHNGAPSWGDAGIDNLLSELSTDEAAVFRVPNGYGAVSLTKSPEKGPTAERLFARDVIFKIGDMAVASAKQVKQLINSHKAGETIAFYLVRNGAITQVDVTLAEGWQASQKPDADYYAGYLGMSVEMWHDQDDEKGQFKTPVITKVYGLSPAHKGRITSSQNYVVPRGPFMMPALLDVKTITGVVIDGVYSAISNVNDLERMTSNAFASQQPMLLEIETWRRSNPRNPETPLEHSGTAYHLVTPTLTTAALPEEAQPAIDTAAKDSENMPSTTTKATVRNEA